MKALVLARHDQLREIKRKSQAESKELSWGLYIEHGVIYRVNGKMPSRPRKGWGAESSRNLWGRWSQQFLKHCFGDDPAPASTCCTIQGRA